MFIQRDLSKFYLAGHVVACGPLRISKGCISTPPPFPPPAPPPVADCGKPQMPQNEKAKVGQGSDRNQYWVISLRFSWAAGCHGSRGELCMLPESRPDVQGTAYHN